MPESAHAQEPIAESVSRLAALRDELRLQAHLAGMDARDQWERDLRPQLEALESALRRGAGEARLQAHLGLMELRQGWQALEPRLLDVVDQVRAAGRSTDGQRLRELLQAAKEAVVRATTPKASRG